MARQSKTKVDAGAIYVAWQSFVCEIGDETYAFPKGTRLRGDHAAVKRMGAAAFVVDGTPSNEWPSPFDPAVETGARLGAETAGITTREMFRARRTVKVDLDGTRRTVKRGEVLDPEDVVTKAVPSAFEVVRVPA